MLTLPIELDVKTVQLSDEQFYQLCVSNPDVKAELTAEGALILMPPVGGYSGNQEFELSLDLGIWNRRTQLGKVFSSSTVFKLPGGGNRSPDAAWVARSRWEALSDEQRRKFSPIAPDFVIELRSSTDSLSTLQDKMLEYLDSGVRLGWMFNPQGQKVEIYRLGKEKEVITLPVTLSGEDVLPGFITHVPVFSGF